MATFTNPKICTVKVKTALKADGYLLKDGETGATAEKILSMPGLKVDIDADDAFKVFDAIHGTIGEVVYDKLSAVKTITSGVE